MVHRTRFSCSYGYDGQVMRIDNTRQKGNTMYIETEL
jgi:hypothetical protein